MSSRRADMSDSSSDIEQETDIDNTDEIQVALTPSPRPSISVGEEENVRTHSPFVPQADEDVDTPVAAEGDTHRLPSYSALMSNRARLPPMDPPTYHKAVVKLGSRENIGSVPGNASDSDHSSSADESTTLLAAAVLASSTLPRDGRNNGENNGVELQEMGGRDGEGETPAPPAYNVAVSRVAAGISRPLETTFSEDVETRFSLIDPETGEAAGGRDEPPPTYAHIAEGEAATAAVGASSDLESGSTYDLEGGSGDEADSVHSSRPPTPEYRDTSLGHSILGAFRRCRMGGSATASTKRTIIIVCMVVSLLILFVALFPFQFSYVQYYQYALAKTKSTGRVITDRVYQHGCYVLGADREFIYLNRTIQTIEFNNLGMFTQDNVDVSIKVQVYYFLKFDSIGALWKDYAGDHAHVIEAATKTAIRNYGPRLSQQDYLLRREYVEELLHDALNKKFSDWGITVYLVNYQNLHLPKRVLERKLKLLVIRTDIEKELAYQKQRAIELQTELLTTKVEYQAKEAINNGTTTAAAIRTVSQTEKAQHVDLAHSAAFKSMMGTLNTTQMDHALSFYYLATLNTLDHFAGSLQYSKRGLYTQRGS